MVRREREWLGGRENGYEGERVPVEPDSRPWPDLPGQPDVEGLVPRLHRARLVPLLVPTNEKG